MLMLSVVMVTEFQPGVPWKGIPSAGDPESDPFMTPGSVMNPPGPQSLQDSDHPLLRDNTGTSMLLLLRGNACLSLLLLLSVPLRCSSTPSCYRLTISVKLLVFNLIPNKLFAI